MRIWKIAGSVGLAITATVPAAEFGIGYFGVTDFPLYENSLELGYIPRANQRGSFLGKYT
jgi:hypothetical protein